MTSLIAKFVFKRIFKESLDGKASKEDDFYFEHVPATRLDGTPSGKVKKQHKATPPGLSKNDAEVLTKVKRRAYRLDMCLWNCCGIRFGWSSVLGLIPAIGDVMDMMLALLIVRSCGKVDGGLPATVKTRMMINVVLDFAVGLVPFLGDVADAAFRANTRNAALLEAHLREKGKKTLRSSGVDPNTRIDHSDPRVWDDMQESDGPSQPEMHAPPPHAAMSATRPGNGNGRDNVSAPAPAHHRQNSSSLFDMGRTRQPDVEMGLAGSNTRLQKQQRH